MRNFSRKQWLKTDYVYEEETSRRSSLYSKNVVILNFELLPNIQNSLDWHEIFVSQLLDFKGNKTQQI